ncbi:hypothetical protein E2C01_093576 [Portunus trituberculatus]|uniref:Uncharacterized protein n=1 Tax=Portunus trituberculatus TaxID=210409 RepID=A0A5B7JYL4_PORTR|nr:hypothetical protein [Portunus trituberculatus]
MAAVASGQLPLTVCLSGTNLCPRRPHLASTPLLALGSGCCPIASLPHSEALWRVTWLEEILSVYRGHHG